MITVAIGKHLFCSKSADVDDNSLINHCRQCSFDVNLPEQQYCTVLNNIVHHELKIGRTNWSL